MLDHPLSDEPGTRFVYNSGGSHLLSAVLQSAVELPVALNEPMTVTDNILTLTWDWDLPFGAYAITLTPAGDS